MPGSVNVDAPSRWGLPRIRGNGRFVAANSVDALGSGLLLAFQVLYFARTTSLSLPEVGAALSVAMVLAIPMPVPVGPLIDRFGARQVALAGNLVSAVGFAGFLMADSAWKIGVVATITQFGSAMYWTSSSALVVLAAASGGERTRWFGFTRALRNIGVGLGGGLASLAVGLGGVTALRGIVIADVLSYLVAAFLLATWQPPVAAAEPADGASDPAGSEPEPVKVGYLQVLRDLAYVRLVVINLSFVLAAMVLGVLLAAYISYGLHDAAWIAGTLIVVNTGLVAGTQTLANRVIEHRAAHAVIAAASALNCASYLLFGLAGVLPSALVVLGLFVAMVIYTASEILGTLPMNELSVAMAPPAARGRYLAVYQLSWTAGAALAPWLLTTLLAVGPYWPWTALFVASALAIPLAFTLPRHRSPGAQPVPDPAGAQSAELELASIEAGRAPGETAGPGSAG